MHTRTLLRPRVSLVLSRVSGGGIAAPTIAGENSWNKGGTASGPILGAAGTSSRPTSGSAGASSHPVSGASSRSISDASLRSIYGTAGASSRPISGAGVPSSVGDGGVPGERVATGAGVGLSARDRGGGMGGISSGAEVVEIAPDDAAAVPAVRLPLPHNLEPPSPCRLAASASMPALAARAGPNSRGGPVHAGWHTKRRAGLHALSPTGGPRHLDIAV
mmetsp:Transcript_28237/g.89990  ORF Transcript_28237/g.89990 Transcript_28237/m.89990 type:complete len:219 (-) Transcript_28237:154-810(-)